MKEKLVTLIALDLDINYEALLMCIYEHTLIELKLIALVHINCHNGTDNK